MSAAKHFPTCSIAALAALALAFPAAAAADPPSWTPMAGVDPRTPPLAQSGAQADALRASLKRIRLPAGFAIELFALVPDARHLAVAPGADLVFVGTQTGTVWAVAGAAAGAPQVRAFAPGAGFANPNGVCLARDGTLFVAERNRVSRYRAPHSWADPAQVEGSEVLARGRLIPPAEESPGHGARTCRVGPDDRLYVTLGQPYNVPPLTKLQRFRELGMGGIVRMNLDGSGREVFATGLRNSVGQDFNPADGTLWFTDNQTDLLGDDVPPGELNRAPRAGLDFGYPYWNGHFKVAGSSVAPDLKDLPEPAAAVFPLAEFPAHQAQLGMSFYAGTQFPPHYRGGIFVAAHGSWNRSVSTGALVNYVPLVDAARAGAVEVFAEGFRNVDGSYWGRPVDVAVLHDGSLLVSDDRAGALYRVTYRP